MVRENAKTRPFFIPRLDEWEGNGNELYFRDVTVVWTNLRSVELLSFFCSCWLWLWLWLFFFWSLSLSLASLKKPSVCYVPGWGFAHIQRWARFPKIVKSKVQKALGFPNRVFQSCHPQPKLSLNLVIQIVTVQARIYTGFHRWNWNWWDFHDKYNKAFN